MTRREFSLLLGAGGWAGARAAGPVLTGNDRAKSTVADALKALGGEKFLAVRDVVESGRVYGFSQGQLAGLAVARVYLRFLDERSGPSAPFAQVQERVSVGKKGEDYAYLYTGGKGYELTYRGVRLMDPVRADIHLNGNRHDVITLLRLRLDEPGMFLQSKGSDIVDNQPVETVEFIDSENRSTVVHFARSTKLPIRADYSWRDHQTNLPNDETIIYSKFRDVGGVNWPFVVQRRRNDRKSYEKYAETVAINTGLSDSLFTLKAGTQVLDPI